jgi:hypothetical protein
LREHARNNKSVRLRRFVIRSRWSWSADGCHALSKGKGMAESPLGLVNWHWFRYVTMCPMSPRQPRTTRLAPPLTPATPKEQQPSPRICAS